ncbi:MULTISPECIES: type II secretion system minor pseudopilin GspK [unclassified Vibrio]|uniref:Type II secretion system protein K n=1 Tax=Vibrio sp. HB236076 TaxID=3232307 RepID=A0AB39HCL2_9VIBR|nr:type II secretion system minor pseudopilin GspK [Vibrio sp. HB161653]MDP5255221.1 type II secretion system minor pseudopilin GspK [Vibrio sp. HB161653]
MNSPAVTRSRGVALIIVLLILAMMTTIAASMSERLWGQFARATHTLDYQQAYWYSLGVEALAKTAIEKSYEDDDDVIALDQPWATEEQVYPLDNGQVQGHIVDMQACFNLNALANATADLNATSRPFLVSVLLNLLEATGIDSAQAEVIADSTWEFIDSNSVTNSQTGVEERTYESFDPAYLSPNTFLADGSEMRSVYQMSGAIMQTLSGLVCALPDDDWRLNVNTLSVAQAPLLVALFSPTLSLSQAQELIESRPTDGWESVETFLDQSALSTVTDTIKDEADGYLTVDSRYFELDAQVTVGESRVRLRSLLYSSNRETAEVIRRRFGGISERVSNRSAE